MNKCTFIVFLAVVAATVSASSIPVHPEERLYFSIPIPLNTGNQQQQQGQQGQQGQQQQGQQQQQQQPQLAIRPLGQAIGNFLTNLFGGAPAGSQVSILPLAQALSMAFQPGGQLNVMPFGQALGIILKAIFG